MKLLSAVVAAASGLGTACLSVPPYQGPAQIVYSDDNGGAFVATSSFALHFASGSGFHFPDNLLINGADVLGHTTSLCWGQRGTGLAVMPMPPVSGDPETGGPMATSHLQATLRGPAVVQVQIDWTTRFDFQSRPMCSPNPNHTPGGSSTFTVFPDGRIVRHDHLTDTNPNMEQIVADQCTCPDPALVPEQFYLSSYWAFARDLFPEQVGLGDPNDPNVHHDLGAVPNAIISNYDTICLGGTSGTYQIASVWEVPPGAGPDTFGYDALVSHDVQKSPTQTLDFSWDVHGALFIEQAGCTAAFTRAIDYSQQQSKLSVNGTTHTSSLLDGMFGGDMGDGKPPGIDVPDDAPTTLSLPPPSPDGTPPPPFLGQFVVRLRFPRAVNVPTATREGANGSANGFFYVPQRVGDDDWIIWFQDPLQAGTTITVRPN